MKQSLTILGSLLLLLLSYHPVLAQETTADEASALEAAEGLDLTAVSELFKDSENLEEFEKALNDPETGINNLDLDENGEVDFIRVVEEAAEGTHVIILQVPLGKDEYQDVATIEIEKNGEEAYNMQIHGNEVLYGANYYIAPVRVRIHTWPIIARIYRPAYRPYRSAYYFGFYPRWWKPFRPVKIHIYRSRTARFAARKTFVVRKTSTVRSVTKVKYRPRTSTVVVRKRTVIRSKDGKRTTVKRRRTKVRK